MLPWQTVQADTYMVTNTNDSGPGSLRQAITSANNHPGADIITFAAATNGDPIVLAGLAGEDANASGDLDILNGGDLTIEGNGAANTIIDGGGTDRVFHVCPGGGCTNIITIQGVTIRNGSADFGGGILNLGATLVVQDSTIGGVGVGNTAIDEGGGIDNQAGTTTLDGTTISANRAEYGGGICNHATLNVQNGSAIGGIGASNRADNGGGIHNYAGTMTVKASTVISNTASVDGGGIYNYAGSTTVEASTVISNTASDDGGGIYIEDGTATVEESTVSANIAIDDGGGIYNHATLEVQNSTIGRVGASNRAEYGGGIHNFSGQTTVDGSTISANQASHGGGIYNHYSATLNVQNGSTIGGAGAGNTVSSYGGGIYNGSSGTTTVDASTVSANTAEYGGGIFNDASPVVQNVSNGGHQSTATSSILAPAALTVQNSSTIGEAGAGNKATVNGGGIFNWYGTATVEASNVISNMAVNGGGIFNWHGTTKVDASTVISNTAMLDGGGINNYYGSTLTVEGCTVSANTAANGGGIHNSATLNVTNSTIGGAGAGNTSTLCGGGIYNGPNSMTTVDGSTVSANTAEFGGGIYNDATPPTLNSSTIGEATAAPDRILALATLTVQNGSTIGGAGVGNTASSYGGGIYNAYSFITNVIGSRILHNMAAFNGGGVFDVFDNFGAISVTGSCIVGNSDKSFITDKPTQQTATGNWWGAVGGPGAPGADTVGGLVDTSGSLDIPILGCAPDLQVDKTNNIGGVGVPGTPFNWTLTVANTGVMDAIFYAGQRILDDDLPAGPTYSEPLVGNMVDITNGANIACSIADGTLTCEATGENVTIAAATGRFEVVLPVMPNTSGTLSNPAGNCRVDPGREVTESDESNNNCPTNVVNVTYLTTYLPLVIR
jgi:hypothetical protein